MASHQRIAQDVTAVVTACGQGTGLVESVESVLGQSVRPVRIIVVDDGSADRADLDAALHAPKTPESHAGGDADCVTIVRLDHVRLDHNSGVSAARNAGIALANTPYICVLDGGDRLLPHFVERTLPVLHDDPNVVAASGWLKCFGVLNGVVRPVGGTLADFLPRDCCPSACLLRRGLWERRGGYDESMREGFEDWEFHIGLLEAGGPDARIEVVDEPLVNLRTLPGQSGTTYMQRRSRALGRIISRHRESYAAHVESTVLALDSLAGDRLRMWEDAVQVHPELLQHSMRTRSFMDHPTFGDGGVEAAVRINRARCSAPFYPAE